MSNNDCFVVVVFLGSFLYSWLDLSCVWFWFWFGLFFSGFVCVCACGWFVLHSVILSRMFLQQGMTCVTPHPSTQTTAHRPQPKQGPTNLRSPVKWIQLQDQDLFWAPTSRHQAGTWCLQGDADKTCLCSLGLVGFVCSIIPHPCLFFFLPHLLY